MARELGEFVNLFGPSARHVLGMGRVPSRTHASNNKNIFVDVINEEKTIYIYAEIPGVNKENIEIDFYNNKLTITADKVRSYDTPEISEIKFGRYERVLSLPICITKRETVSVTYNNGILKIKINKLIEEENKFTIRPSE